MVLVLLVAVGDKKHPQIGELQLLIPDSREFLDSLDFSLFSSAEAASENLEKSLEPRNSLESGIRTVHSSTASKVVWERRKLILYRYTILLEKLSFRAFSTTRFLSQFTRNTRE